MGTESEVTFNYSGTTLAEFSNSSNTTTESMCTEETFKWTTAEITRLIQIIFRPILIIIGTVGNSLTIYIMRRTSLKYLSTCFYMSVLALADTSKYMCHGIDLFALITSVEPVHQTGGISYTLDTPTT